MSEKPLGMLIGSRIRAARIELGATQKDFADLIGTNQSHMSDIETGRSPDFRVSTLVKIAEALGVPLSHLIDPSPVSELLLELARRNTADERLAERDSMVAFTRFDSDQGMYFRGVAAGLRVAQNNQLAITQERKAADVVTQPAPGAEHPVDAQPCDESRVSDVEAGRQSPTLADQAEAAGS